MATKITRTELVYSDGTVSIAENGFVRVGNRPLGVLLKSGQLQVHIRNSRTCDNCKKPTVDLLELIDLGKKYGISKS